MKNYPLISLLFKLAIFGFFLVLNLSLFGQGKTKIPPQDKYFGQKPPEMTAELFAKGIVSSELCEHSSPTFSPDGKLVLWTIMDSNYHGYLLEMRYENGKWSKPAKPSFADETADDYYPEFAPDGKKLYFSSRRKVPAGYPKTKDMRIWEVARTDKGWGNPVPFDTTVSKGEEYAHSVAKNGTIYFSSIAKGGKKMEIAFAPKKNGTYQIVQTLNFDQDIKFHYDGVFIAPDENFLIFESDRAESLEKSIDLYICFRKKDGTWTNPKNMGTKINTKFGERFARLSPDGKYLFFGSTRSGILDIYWIDAKIIAELREKL